MRILVIGLDCAAPEILLEDQDLHAIRWLMEAGVHGRLESVVPPITVPAWMCMATSQDPGSLGVYGFTNRPDRGYTLQRTVSSDSFHEFTAWDQVAREGGRSILAGCPPSYPPRRMNGLSVGCFLTPDPSRNVFTHPAGLSDRIRSWVGDYPVDVKDFRTEDKDRLHRDLLDMTHKHFEVIHRLMREEPWDYMQFVEIGLDRIHHGFWKHHDPRHRLHDPDNPYRDVVRSYYRLLDGEIATLLASLDEETLVVVLSDHGAKALEGGFCVNDWLRQEGLLHLNTVPSGVTPFAEADVDWERTVAWSSGGYAARLFLNVRGREPRGSVHPMDVDSWLDEITERLEATNGPDGKPLGTRVFRPREVYRNVRGIAPDLVVHFGDLAWRAVSGVGYGAIHVDGNDTGPDDCNHAQFGAFVLAGPGVPALGEVQGAHLLDIAPTVLELAGYDVPSTMQGRRIVTPATSLLRPVVDPADDAVVRDRLSGLGYLS